MKTGKEFLRGLAPLVACLALAAAAAMFATACSTLQVPKILNPIGWFKSDPLKKIEAAEEHVFLSKVALVTIAQGLLAGTIVELQSVPRPDASTLRALDYAKRAQENLSQALGPQPPAQVRAVEELVRLRASPDAKDRAKGDKQLAKVDERSAEEVAKLYKTRQLLDALREKEAAALKRAQVAEGQRDAFVFWGIVAFAAWLFFAHVLPRLAELHPATAGLARAATGFAKLFAHTGRKQP